MDSRKMTTLIRNARLISPDLDIPGGALLLEDGRIAAVVRPEQALPAADESIDVGGCVVMPGFIDIHSHGADGHDVCDNSLDAIRHIAWRKLQEGVTTWLPTTLTQPRESLEEIAGKCAEYMAAPEFCRVPGLHVEGPFINPRHVGAQNPAFVRPPDFGELMRLHAIAPVRIVSLAPELDGAGDFIRRATAAGIICSAAHTSATAAEILAAKGLGLRHLTHFCNAMTPLHHREIGAVGAGLLDDALMLELICDGIHLCPDMVRLISRFVAIGRLMLVTDSMAASWLERGEVKLGGLEVIVENCRAVLKQGGALAGSALRFNEGLRIMAETTGLPLPNLAATTSWNQARALGLYGFGKLEAGFHADLVVLDADFSVRKTFVGGEFRGGW
jgi:N-acetylglucosamine-6-phosphate deacetylase